jgi:DNA polymerase-4
VVSEREVKSISQERTFARDIDRLATLKGSLWRMSQRVSERLLRSELAAGTVSIKMRYADFSTLTRQMRLMVPTDDAVEIYRAALTLFERVWEQGQPVRLLGVGGSQLEPPSGQLPLWETDGRV